MWEGSKPVNHEVHSVLDEASKFHDDLSKMSSGYFSPTVLIPCLGIKTFTSLLN